MKRLLLELGGKGACIVFDDADLKAAIGGISSVWAFHSGQICTAPTRVIVHRSHPRPARRRASSQAIGHLKVGDPMERDTVVGPGHLRRAPRPHRGLRRLPASTRAPRSPPAASGPTWTRGFYVAPTLLVDCTHRDDPGARGALRPGGRRRALRRRGRGRRRSPTTATSACTATCSPPTRAGPGTWRSGCARATSASTRSSATTRRPSGASSSRASAATAATTACTPTPSCSRSSGRAEQLRFRAPSARICSRSEALWCRDPHFETSAIQVGCRHSQPRIRLWVPPWSPPLARRPGRVSAAWRRSLRRPSEKCQISTARCS